MNFKVKTVKVKMCQKQIGQIHRGASVINNKHELTRTAFINVERAHTPHKTGA